jgi:probable phosphoglycerate mutase
LGRLGRRRVTEPTRVLAIRHGETAWNVASRIQGQLDIGLNDTGRWQAAQLVGALADESPAALYSSDLGRAHETARLLGDAVGLGVVADAGLRERGFGVFEGHTFVEVEQRWPEASLRWRKRDPGFGPDGGETLAGFYQRAVAAAERLAMRHRGETIVLVTHGGVLDCLYRAAARADLRTPRSWLLPNAAINRLLYAGDGFTLIGWSDTTHLDSAVAAAS